MEAILGVLKGGNGDTVDIAAATEPEPANDVTTPAEPADVAGDDR
jgi:hypothetical protein